MPPSPPPGTTISPSTSSKGRSLKATQQFPAGSLIATFTNPLLALPDGSSMRTTCNYCLQVESPQTPMRACTGCKAAVYCNAKCQRAHWKQGGGVHKAECKMFTLIRSTTGKEWLPTPVRAVAQVLLLLQAGDTTMAEAFLGPEGLEGNVEEFRKDSDVWADYELQAMAAVVYGGLLQSEEMINKAKEILCKIQTNAFNRLDADAGTAGIFLDQVLAMVNHSCVPNAFVGFDKRTAMLRAQRDIEPGEEIEISYCDFVAPRSVRWEALKLYHFQCGCPRCRDDLDAYQVCSASPHIPLNKFSLQPNLSKLRNPDVDRSKVSSAEIEAIYRKWRALKASENLDVMQLSRLQWKLCKPLVEARMFAVEPLPAIILDLVKLCISDPKKTVYALPLSCFLSTECEPVNLVAPFLPWRIKGLMMLAKLLVQVGEMRATGELEKTCSYKPLVDILTKSDQVSMCEAVLRLVVHYGPMGASEDWDVLKEASDILKEIESLQGREQESYFLRTWAKDPKDPEASAFFENAVLKPINDLAALAIGVVDAGLGDGKSLVPV
ncbi:hypothetical protein V8F20_009685 [Naviculisporaceae sp. PSN 640]